MYSMHKKNVVRLLYRSSAGFLLTEFMIAFAVLSLSVVICAHVFFSAAHEFTRAKQRLQLYSLAQNNIEFSWSGGREEGIITSDGIKKQILPIEAGILLPTVPNLKQEWLELNVRGQSPHARLRGRVRDE